MTWQNVALLIGEVAVIFAAVLLAVSVVVVRASNKRYNEIRNVHKKQMAEIERIIKKERE